MTQMELAKRGIITKEVRKVAKKEGVSARKIREGVARGRIVIVGKNENVCGIGEGLRTKINANVGTSPDYVNIKEEVEKVNVAVRAGADTIMDLSVGGELREILRTIIKTSRVPVGSVPIYWAGTNEKFYETDEDKIFRAIEEQVKLGASFLTIHSALTRKGLKLTKKRTMRMVSRGGCFLASWMEWNNKENPLYENFDYVVELLKREEVVLSLGDALRPGCLRDACDRAQMEELRVQGELVKRAHKNHLSVICEGPGHIPINKIAKNVRIQKKLCSGAPYYVLGPLVTDIGIGYDHICGAIGGALAALAGADFLCVVTPAEHIALPTKSDVEEGVIAFKLAAHSADIVKLKSSEMDLEMSKARAKLNWKKVFSLALSSKANKQWKERGSKTNACSMCGRFCALKISQKF